MKFVVNIYFRDDTGGKAADREASYERLYESLEDEYPGHDFHFTCIDVDSADNLTDHDSNLMEQIEGGDLRTPLVTVNDEIASSGSDPLQIVEWFRARI